MDINRRDFLKGTFVLAGGLIMPSCLNGRISRNEKEYDVVVYGATSSGIVAAVQAARLGHSVVLVEPSNHLGGLTTGGLGSTDLGTADAVGGISREFYQRIKKHYENDDVWTREPTRVSAYTGDAMWAFEPNVAKKVYYEMLEEHNIPVVMEDRLILNREGVNKTGNKITAIKTESGNVYKGRIFIDATYEGDLMAMAGVSFHVGREANSVYDETLNGIQKVRTHNHILPGFVDPYIVAGNRNSGILPGVHDGNPGVDFEGDHRVQAYCFRMCLTDAPENRVAFAQPEGYDELEYELLFRNFEAGENRVPWLPGMMPNRKTDTNNRWGFSTNKIGINYKYPEGNYSVRESIIMEQEHYQKGLMWTLANHPRVPTHIREEVGKWGLAADEFTDNNNWPTQIYVREARRMIGEHVMTEHDCRRLSVATDSIGLGSYAMDSHNVQRYITEMGCVQNEGNIEVSTQGPYAISYKSIIPKEKECDNLLVTCAISASHIAFGSIRMEPVFMITGQSAAVVASLAIEQNTGVHGVDYLTLSQSLLSKNQRIGVDTDMHTPLPMDEKAPTQRLTHSSEPVLDSSC
jgi:hypothetical protein